MVVLPSAKVLSDQTRTRKMGHVVILGVFVADTAYRSDRMPQIGETVLGNSFALGSIKFKHIRPRHQKYAFEREIPGRMKGLLQEGNKYVGFVVEQLGGAPSKLKVGELRTMCNNYGMSCRDKDGKYLPRDKLIKLLQPFL